MTDTVTPTQMSIETVITGLIGDLQALREGKMSTRQAEAHAMLAKQIFNGLRLAVIAQRTIESAARQIGNASPPPAA